MFISYNYRGLIIKNRVFRFNIYYVNNNDEYHDQNIQMMFFRTMHVTKKCSVVLIAHWDFSFSFSSFPVGRMGRDIFHDLQTKGHTFPDNNSRTEISAGS